MMRQQMDKRTLRRAGLSALLLLGVLGLAACGGEAEGPVRQAPPVTVAKPVVKPVAPFQIFTGSTRAFESTEVVARVAGALETVEFEASSQVKAGDLLFTIEKERYVAARDVAQASLESAKADLLRSETELQRVEKASESRAVSEMDVDRARADRDMAIATVASAKARLDDAELDLSYTQVRAPITGVVSRNLVDPGNLVGQGQSTLLTRINRVSPIFVYFHAPESAVLRFLAERREMMDQMEEIEDAESAIVEVALANEEGFPHQGVLDFIDNQVDARTGTIEMRARLENTDLSMFPGLFVRVKVTAPRKTDGLLVPETCIGTDLGGKYVLTVDAENIVQQAYVELGLVQGDGLVHIRTGLEGDESIIVNGLRQARPGLPVQPMTAEQAAAMATEPAAKD